MKKPIITGILVALGFWIIGEITISQVIAPETQTFVRIGLLAVAIVFGIGASETIRGYQEEDDERYK